VTISIRGLAAVLFGFFLPLTLLGALIDHFYFSHTPLLTAIGLSALRIAAGIALGYGVFVVLPLLLRAVLRWLERP
jgi:hypothetical protein